jgi:hypothetical protein
MMTGRFPTLRRFLIKMIEVAGAGCASAIAAFLLGNSHEAERPPMPVPPAVVRLAPADEQMIRHVRDESAVLAEQLRSNTAAAVPANSPAIAPAAQKPAKSAATTSARREQKTTRTAPVEAKQRPVDPPAVVAAAAASAPTPYGTDRAPAAAPYGSDAPTTRAAEPKDVRVSAPPAAPTESSPPAPAQVPSRLWPAAVSSVRDAPRPPLGVGEYLSSSM